jgi:hypothetical protein
MRCVSVGTACPRQDAYESLRFLSLVEFEYGGVPSYNLGVSYSNLHNFGNLYACKSVVYG